VSAREQATQRIQAVEDAFTHAEGAWSSATVSVTSFFGLSSAQSQVLGAIRSMRKLGFEPWQRRASTLAESDQAGWDRWVKDGNDMLKNLADTAQDASTNELDVIIADTVVATAVEVKEDAVVALKWGTPVVLVAAAVAAVVWWKVK